MNLFTYLLAGSLAIAGAGALIAGLALLVHVALYGVATHRGEMRDALIFAAHPDDCVVLAGEYALEALRAGRRVEIAYLTCGSADSGDARAQVRRAEARAAWSVAGLPASALHFLDLPQSPVRGPSEIGLEYEEFAGARLADLLRKLPRDAAIFVPAAGETHVDHRTTRRLAHAALRASGRTDLIVYEAPEYNEYHSLLHCPARTLRAIARSLPLLARRVSDAPADTRPGFVHGGRAYELPPDAARLATKVALLREFRSEGGDRLVHLFGHADRFRPVGGPCCESDRPRGYARIGANYFGPAALALWLAVWNAALSTAALAVYLLFGFCGAWLAVGLAGFVGVLVIRAILRSRQGDRRLSLCSIEAGLVFGVVASLAGRLS
jgi:LmbE family N-acetylglucosaminyl deacetylase